MSLKKEFGKRVKFLREERKLSQAKLGELIGVKALAVSRIENGENFVRAETLEAIKNAFCVNYKELFDFEEENIDDSKSKRILCHLNGLNEKEIEFFISVIQAYKNIK